MAIDIADITEEKIEAAKLYLQSLGYDVSATLEDVPVKKNTSVYMSTPLVAIPLETYFPDCILPNCPAAGRKHQHILDHQREIMLDDNKYLYCQGGVGSAKSVAFAAKTVQLCMDIPENVGVVSRRDYKMLFKSSWLLIKRCVKRLVDAGYIDHDWYIGKGKMFTDKRQGDYTTINFPNGSVLYAMQGKNWSEGLGADYGLFWVDDAMESFEEMFIGDETNGGLISRLRLGVARYHPKYYDGKLRKHGGLHGMVSSNPPPIGHWLHKLFGKVPGLHKLGDDFVRWMLVSTLSNPFTGIDYARSIMAVQDKMGKSTNNAKRMVHGESVPAYGGTPVFPEFDHAKHVGEYPFNPDLPLVCGWDFGFHHPAVVFNNLDKCKYGTNHLISIGEIADAVSLNVFDLYEKFVLPYMKQRFKDAKIVMHAGDRAGWRKSSSNRDNRGDMRILKEEYNLPFLRRDLDLENSLQYMRSLLQPPVGKRCECGEQLIKIDGTYCEVLIGALQGGYKYPKRRDANNVMAKIGNKPIEDKWFADVACAWRYGAENFVKWGIPWEWQQQMMVNKGEAVIDLDAQRRRRNRVDQPWSWMEMSDADMAKLISS